MNKNENKDILDKIENTAKTREFTGIPNNILKVLFVAFSLFCIFIVRFSTADPRVIRSLFVGFMVFFVYILYPVKKHKSYKVNYVPWYDLLLGTIGLFCYLNFAINSDSIIKMGILLPQHLIIIGIIGLLITLEACRRVTGLPIVIVSIVFIALSLTRSSLKLSIVNLFYTTQGLIGTPIGSCVNYIAMFIIFGSFLERTGISEFFIRLANSIAGSSIGGPAKVSVISSALCGMVSGSSVGNTVTTGAITIPLMKKNGYKPEFAGAVEAAASTGGQIMPPIMGAAAFLMIEYTNCEYSYIALRACLPALLYFAGIFVSVHLEAKKLKLKGIPKSELPNFFDVILRSWYLLLPLIVLTILIIKNTMSNAALVAIGLTMLLSMIDDYKSKTIYEKFFKMIKTSINALENGAKSILSVGIACAVAGTIAGSITTTGMGLQLTNNIATVSNGNILIAMFLTMITCIILGMGVPTTANYVIMATTCAPILINMGMQKLAAHMFVFYFGIVADITPPVALAAYAGSAIAKASPIKTAINATLLAIAAFIIPYVFGLNPAMLFINTSIDEVILIIITSLIGIFGVSSGIIGYINNKLSVIGRIVIILGGLMLIYPGIITDIIGIIIVISSVIINTLKVKTNV